MFEGQDRCRGGVLETDPGVDAVTVADDRVPPLADRLANPSSSAP
jgi:hypothetical protein